MTVTLCVCHTLLISHSRPEKQSFQINYVFRYQTGIENVWSWETREG